MKMTAEDEKKAEAVTEAEAAEEEIESELEVSSLRILAVTHELHQKHGLRHGDYQRYRGYCARRIARVRKAIKMVQGEKKKFNKKVSWSSLIRFCYVHTVHQPRARQYIGLMELGS